MQRLLFFKIPYLDGKCGAYRGFARGQGRGVKDWAVNADAPEGSENPPDGNRFLPAYDSRSITKLPYLLARKARVALA
jgi:hypothetical protein